MPDKGHQPRERIMRRLCQRCGFSVGPLRDVCSCGGAPTAIEYLRADLVRHYREALEAIRDLPISEAAPNYAAKVLAGSPSGKETPE